MKKAVIRKSKGAARLTPIGKRRLDAGSEYRLKKHDTCPFQLWLAAGEKLEEPGNKYMEDGKRVHALAEKFVLDDKEPMARELALKFKPDFNALRKLKKGKKAGIFTEQQLALDANHEPTEWFAKNVRWRGAVDLLVIQMKRKRWEARVIDYKYAKLWGGDDKSYARQVRNYAVYVFAHHPEVSVVTAELWFLKTGDVVEMEFACEEFDELKETMTEEYAALFADRRFDPKPSERECGRCHFRKSNGGVCKNG